MTGRILVVDDVALNRQLLEQYLMDEYFEVTTAENGLQALEICQNETIELVILDVMMPKMDGFTVCSKLKNDLRTHHIPVIMVTMLDRPADKVKGLDAGADDFLQKPVDQIALITRVKNLVRLKRLTDELHMRTTTVQQIGLPTEELTTGEMSGQGGRILVVESQDECCEWITSKLQLHHTIIVEQDPQKALDKAISENVELSIISIDLDGADGLRLCSQIRSSNQTRNLPIIVLIRKDENEQLLRGLDMGVNDYVVRPLDENELLARVTMQLKRTRYTAKLRQNFQQNVELSIIDSLTGLYNRRYLGNYLDMLIKQPTSHERKLSILISDIDHFKLINDTHGHDAGDAILFAFATRLRASVRGVNLVCRYGGEEFVIVLPDMDIKQSYDLAERVRQNIASTPFEVMDLSIPVTVSIGLATWNDAQDAVEHLFKRADQALYKAKNEGRNRISVWSE